MSEQKCPNCGKEMRGSDDAAAPEMAELLERIALHGPPMSYFDGGSVGRIRMLRKYGLWGTQA